MGMDASQPTLVWKGQMNRWGKKENVLLHCSIKVRKITGYPFLCLHGLDFVIPPFAKLWVYATINLSGLPNIQSLFDTKAFQKDLSVCLLLYKAHLQIDVWTHKHQLICISQTHR